VEARLLSFSQEIVEVREGIDNDIETGETQKADYERAYKGPDHKAIEDRDSQIENGARRAHGPQSLGEKGTAGQGRY
jgi:hypothetical protein